MVGEDPLDQFLVKSAGCQDPRQALRAAWADRLPLEIGGYDEASAGLIIRCRSCSHYRLVAGVRIEPLGLELQSDGGRGVAASRPLFSPEARSSPIVKEAQRPTVSEDPRGDC